MKKKKIIWALLDERDGNRNQVLSILSHLNSNYKIINIKYNFLARLPNIFFQLYNNTIHVKNFKIPTDQSCPDMVISCGRRTATIALQIKKFFSFKPFCVHLMYPSFTLLKSNFNLIFVPDHDHVKQNFYIRKFLGAPSNIKLIKKKKKYSEPIIFLIIGGDHGRFKLSVIEIENIINQVLKKFNNNGSLLISTSRRTSKEIIKKLDYLATIHSIISHVYHPKLSNNENKNPYLEYLSIADEIIVTGDSISMISDACQTKKPVRIYYNKRFCSNKHIRFCNKLIDLGYAFSFETIGVKCKVLKKLDTSEKIAMYINKVF